MELWAGSVARPEQAGCAGYPAPPAAPHCADTPMSGPVGSSPVRTAPYAGPQAGGPSAADTPLGGPAAWRPRCGQLHQGVSASRRGLCRNRTGRYKYPVATAPHLTTRFSPARPLPPRHQAGSRHPARNPATPGGATTHPNQPGHQAELMTLVDIGCGGCFVTVMAAGRGRGSARERRRLGRMVRASAEICSSSPCSPVVAGASAV